MYDIQTRPKKEVAHDRTSSNTENTNNTKFEHIFNSHRISKDDN